MTRPTCWRTGRLTAGKADNGPGRKKAALLFSIVAISSNKLGNWLLKVIIPIPWSSLGMISPMKAVGENDVLRR